MKKRGRRPKSRTLYYAESSTHGRVHVLCANAEVTTNLGVVDFVYVYRSTSRERDGRPVYGRPEWLTTPFLVTDSAWTQGFLVAADREDAIFEDVAWNPVIFNSTFQEFRNARYELQKHPSTFDAPEIILFGSKIGEVLQEACEKGFLIQPRPLTPDRLGHRGYPTNPRNEFWHD